MHKDTPATDTATVSTTPTDTAITATTTTETTAPTGIPGTGTGLIRMDRMAHITIHPTVPTITIAAEITGSTSVTTTAIAYRTAITTPEMVTPITNIMYTTAIRKIFRSHRLTIIPFISCSCIDFMQEWLWQEIIYYHFSITKFNGVKSTNKLPNSFASVALKGEDYITATDIVNKYYLPELFTEWYVQYQDYFKKLRDT